MRKLRIFCQENGIPEPVIQESRTGPVHKLVFSFTCTVEIGAEKICRTAKGNKRIIDQLAKEVFADLLEKLLG